MAVLRTSLKKIIQANRAANAGTEVEGGVGTDMEVDEGEGEVAENDELDDPHAGESAMQALIRGLHDGSINLNLPQMRMIALIFWRKTSVLNADRMQIWL